MQETQLEDAPVVIRKLGQDLLHGLGAVLRGRAGRKGKGEVLVELGL